MATPRGVRNNNPGNIRYVEGITSTYAGCVGSDGAFCKFDTAENGIRALGKLLRIYQSKHGLRTIRGVITRWAPPSENDTEAYIAIVVRLTGVAHDKVLDLRQVDDLFPLVVAIITHENGKQPYELGMIRAALEGTVPPVATQPAAPIEDKSVQQEKPMPIPLALSAIAAFGPAIVEMIPAIAKLFDKHAETPAKLEAAQTVVQTLVKSTSSTNLQEAVEKMSADPVLKKEAEAAVLTAPGVVEYLEIGGGIAAAREANLAVQNSPQGFWRNPAFWFVLVVVVPPLYAVVGVMIWRMQEPSEQLVTQVVTAILGLAALGGAYYLGSTATSARKTELLAQKEQ
jgi:hypothetical protein